MKQSIAGIIFHKNSFLIGLRLATGEMGNRWEFPGGKVDSGETPEMAIKREFKEEMNVDVESGELIASVEFSNKSGTSQLLAYSVFFPENPDIALTEHTRLKWATLDEIEQLSFVDSDLLLIPYIKEWLKNEAKK